MRHCSTCPESDFNELRAAISFEDIRGCLYEKEPATWSLNCERCIAEFGMYGVPLRGLNTYREWLSWREHIRRKTWAALTDWEGWIVLYRQRDSGKNCLCNYCKKAS